MRSYLVSPEIQLSSSQFVSPLRSVYHQPHLLAPQIYHLHQPIQQSGKLQKALETQKANAVHFLSNILSNMMIHNLRQSFVSLKKFLSSNNQLSDCNYHIQSAKQPDTIESILLTYPFYDDETNRKSLHHTLQKKNNSSYTLFLEQNDESNLNISRKHYHEQRNQSIERSLRPFSYYDQLIQRRARSLNQRKLIFNELRNYFKEQKQPRRKGSLSYLAFNEYSGLSNSQRMAKNPNNNEHITCKINRLQRLVSNIRKEKDRFSYLNSKELSILRHQNIRSRSHDDIIHKTRRLEKFMQLAKQLGKLREEVKTIRKKQVERTKLTNKYMECNKSMELFRPSSKKQQVMRSSVNMNPSEIVSRQF